MAGAGLSAAALLGCGTDDDPAPTTAPPAPAAPANGAAAPAPGTIPEGATVPSVPGTPKYEGVWVEPVTATNAQHDTHTALGRTVWHAISERAFELDGWTQELRGQAVESWEIVDDQGLELVMHLRPGLAMHDKEPWNGRDFNAEDLAFNLERNAGLYSEAEGMPLTSLQRRSMVEGLTKAEAVDDLTVRIEMARPNGAIFNGLSEIRTVMMPKGVVELGFTDPTKFASFGAFTTEIHRPGEMERFVRHDRYYREGQPYFDAIERRVLPDRAAIAAAFIDKQISVWFGPQQHERQAVLSANRDANYYEWVGVNWDHFRWNLANPALADARVREAFWLATDRAQINDAYYGPGWGWAAAAIPHFQEAWKQDHLQTLPGYGAATREADRAEAVRLMDAAGYPEGDGISLVIVPTTAAVFEEHSLRFMDQMRPLFPKAHFEVQRPSDATAFATRQAARDFEAICYVITAVNDIFLEWHSQYHTDGSRNYGGFENAESDDLIDRGLRALTQEERLDIAEQFQVKFTTEWFANLIFNARPDNSLVQGNIGGFDYNAGPWDGTAYRLNTGAAHYYYV